MRVWGTVRVVLVALLATLVLAGCQTDWLTWGFGIDRLSENVSETGVGVGNVANLHQVWATSLGGNVNAAPVVASGVTVNGNAIDIAYLGDEHGGFTAVNMADGSVVWRKQFAVQVINNCF